MIKLAPLPAPLRMTDLSVLIATGLGSGRLTPAPGTWGSIAAWIIGLALMMSEAGKASLILALIAACLAGWWAIEQIEEKTDSHDDGMIVIDEWAGIWLTMLFSGTNALQLFLCLVFFRLFDIWKPWPINWLDRNVQGPLGVIIDDIVAGLFAAVCVALVGLCL